ncbi:aldolase [Ammoniphilus oxalaticus]|uniref:Aldolase n=1 Tax=Ammoniphilus oxalaticus TaxID=66863 RepID=A0A419SHB1_9BACL|nr:aldolase [Ammoniphilus oxalaticus]RKD23184.1 aldolase [Ammoniphilus oxalaticus]
MPDTITKVVYKAFGLSIESDIPLPELPQAEDYSNLIDIQIRMDDSFDTYPKLIEDSGGMVIKEDELIFYFEKSGTFRIQEGTKITVSPIPDYDPEMLRLWILGTCMGALLMQRRILPLHGSAIVIEGKAYAVIGDSGAGKSTLATAFMNRGFHLLTDDVIAVSLTEEGIPMVSPSYPQQKLWQESLDQFEMDNDQLSSIYGRLDKYCVPVRSQYFTESVPLGGIFELSKTEDSAVALSPIPKLGQFDTLFRHTYRNFLIPGKGLIDWHFKTSAKIMSFVEMYRLQRPLTGFSANELVSTILNTIGREE